MHAVRHGAREHGVDAHGHTDTHAVAHTHTHAVALTVAHPDGCADAEGHPDADAHTVAVPRTAPDRPRRGRLVTELHPHVRRLSAALVATLTLAVGSVGAASATADDPSQGGLWYYTVPAIDQIQASGTTGAGVTIAVIDGPIDTTAPDLAGSGVEVHEPSFCDASGDGAPEPATSTGQDAAHATQLATLLAGTGAGAAGHPGVHGVAPDATVRVYAMKVQDACNDLAPAVNAAVADGADILSLSFATSDLLDSELAALAAAERAGVVVVAASNNRGGTDLAWPASANGVVSVESADVGQQLNPEAVTSPLLAVVAPGEKILAPAANDDGTWGYAEVYGSSYATAWTAGVLALAWSAHPDATGNQMIQALVRTTAQATGSDPTRIDDSWGYGTVSARKLVAVDPTTLPDTNPLLRDTADAQPAYADIVSAEPVPTTTAEPEPTPAAPTQASGAADSGIDSTPLAIGAVLILLAIAGGIVAVVILTRRNNPNTKGA